MPRSPAHPKRPIRRDAEKPASSIEVSNPEPPLDIEAFLAGADPQDPAPALPGQPAMQAVVEDLGDVMPENTPWAEPLNPAPAPGPILTRYESRIQIIDAYQYHGSVADAPAWVDRNWIGYCDDDPVREIAAGPCLRVPLTGAESSGDVVLCRDGDYIAQQSVTLAPNSSPIIRIEVWNRDMFHKLFLGRDVSVNPNTPEGYQPHPHLSQRDPAVPQPPFDRAPGDPQPSDSSQRSGPTSSQPTTPEIEGDVPDADESSWR